jgi:tRNA A-37 threonylcarbamoyl transferase component Bud32
MPKSLVKTLPPTAAVSITGLSVPPSAPPVPPGAVSDDPLIGAVLHGTYVIRRRIGDGGMSLIYEAHHVRLERRFAVKVLRAHLASSASIRTRFQREVEAVASLSHSGVIGVVDFGETAQGWPYMVSELLAGIDLRVWLMKFGRLSVPSVLHIGQHLADALAVTHARGVIHRDLKPSNVFLVGDFSSAPPERPQVKILDFGLSRFLDREDHLTTAGLVMGTPAYMSPEQAQAGRGDHLSDVYGVGAVLYAAITGEAPFRGQAAKDTVLSVMSREPVRPRKLQPDMPEGLEVVIQRAMAKKPSDRYPDMETLGVALSNLQGRPTSARSKARASAVAQPRQAWPVRFRFLALASLACLWLLAAGVSAGAGLFELYGAGLRLNGTEWVLLIALLASCMALVWASCMRFWRQAWPNSALLLAWLPRVQGPLLAALAAYGSAALCIRLAGELGGWYAPARAWAEWQSVDWPGWAVLVFLLSLAWAGACVARQSTARSPRVWQQWVFGPVLTALTVVASALLLSLGRASPGADPRLLVAGLCSVRPNPISSAVLTESPRDTGASVFGMGGQKGTGAGVATPLVPVSVPATPVSGGADAAATPSPEPPDASPAAARAVGAMDAGGVVRH